jgi:hypothetical protein
MVRSTGNALMFLTSFIFTLTLLVILCAGLFHIFGILLAMPAAGACPVTDIEELKLGAVLEDQCLVPNTPIENYEYDGAITMDFRPHNKMQRNSKFEKLSGPKARVHGIVFSQLQPALAKNTAKNEEAAITMRYLRKVMTAQAESFINLKDWVMTGVKRIFGGRYKLLPPEVAEWFRHMKPAKIRELLKAFASLITLPLNRRIDAVRNIFIKLELQVPKLDAIENWEHFIYSYIPRLVSGTTARFNAVVGPWIYAVAEKLREVWNGLNGILYAKGSDAGRILGDFFAKAAFWGEGDGVKWDLHTGEEALRFVHWVYEWVFGIPRNIIEALNWRFKSKAYSRFYDVLVEWVRHSGDQDTSTGNSILNGCIGDFILQHYDRVRAVDGDDDLTMFLNSTDFALIDTKEVERMWAQFGYEFEYKITNKPSQVTFCSKLFFPTLEDGNKCYRPGALPGKFLAKIGCSFKHIEENHYAKVLNGCASNIDHVPLLHEIHEMVVEMCGGETGVILPEDYPYKLINDRSYPCVEEAYDMFQDRYGVGKLEIDGLCGQVRQLGTFPMAINSGLMLRLVAIDTK